MLGNRDSPGLANRIIDELFAFYDPRTCTLAVSIQELYNVSSSQHLQDSNCALLPMHVPQLGSCLGRLYQRA